MLHSVRVSLFVLAISSAVWGAEPPADAKTAKRFAQAVGAELRLKPRASQAREETHLYPHYRAVAARFKGLKVTRVWLASHAEAMSFANARRIDLTLDGKRESLFTVLEVSGAQVLVASGARLQNAAFVHRVRAAAWEALDGGETPSSAKPVDVGVKYLPARPGLKLLRVRIARPADDYMLELPAFADRASIPGLPSGELEVEPAIGADPRQVAWGARRRATVSRANPLVVIGEGYTVDVAPSDSTGSGSERRLGLTGGVSGD